MDDASDLSSFLGDRDLVSSTKLDAVLEKFVATIIRRHSGGKGDFLAGSSLDIGEAGSQSDGWLSNENLAAGLVLANGGGPLAIVLCTGSVDNELFIAALGHRSSELANILAVEALEYWVNLFISRHKGLPI